MTDDDAFIDRIYEAGALPELWPNVLDEFNEISGSAGSVVFTARGDAARWTASRDFEEHIEAYVERGYMGRDGRTEKLMAQQYAGFLGELDVYQPDEWLNDPIRREYWEPRGYGWGVATHVAVPNGDTLVIHGERSLVAGPVDRATLDRLDGLRPHLARAMMLTNRLSFERLQATVAALEVLGLPAAVLEPHGQVLASNSLLDALTPDLVQARPRRLGFAQAGADALFEDAIGALAQSYFAGPQSVPLPGTELRPPMVAHLHPLRGTARDVFSRAAALLVVTPVGNQMPPSEAVVRGLFDLTPAEARVALGLATGLDLETIAQRHGTSITTVRNQVRAVLAKSGVRRQAEFVALLRGL
jgi:DNA-binding CsgD family transcriptional regulator